MEPQGPGRADEVPLLDYEPLGAPPTGPATSRRRRSASIVAGGVVAVVALVVGVVVLLHGGSDRDADEALAHAQAFVASATSVRFAYHGELAAPDSGDDDEDGPIDGTAEWTAGGWHLDEASGSDRTEIVVVDGTLYGRTTYEGESDSDRWTSRPFTEITRDDLLSLVEFMGSYDEMDMDDGEGLGSADTAGVLASSIVFLNNAGSSTGTLLADPHAFLDAIERMHDPAELAHDGDALTLALTVPAEQDIVDAYGGPLPDIAVELDLDGDDVPTGLRMRVESGDARLTFDLTFSNWGDPFTVDAPDPALVDEDELMSPPDSVPVLDGVTPVRIGESAGVWKIQTADGGSAWADDMDLDEGDPCALKRLVLGWVDGEGDYAMLRGYLFMDLTTRECASPEERKNAPAPEPGRVMATVVDGDSDYMRVWYLSAGDTVGSISFLSVRGGDEAKQREQEVIDALEITDWATIQNDLAAG